MNEFWDFLLIKELPENALFGLNFSMFGFGDSSYAKYNAMARKLYQRTLQLGAVSAIERGLGDDNKEGGYSVDLLVWKKKLFSELGKFFPDIKTDLEDSVGLNLAPEATTQVLYLENSSEDVTSNLGSLLSFVDKNRKASKLQLGRSIKNTRLTAEDHFQNVQDIEIALQDSPESKYCPGDIAVIFPKNHQDRIDSMLKYYEIEENQLLEITLKGQKYTLTAGLLFGYVLRLSEPPKFYVFKLLRFFTNNAIYQDKIKDMSKF